jgi:archaeoflavoprotein AfpA
VAEIKGKRVAWGITGSGDKLAEIVDVMKEVKKRFECKADIRVYLSKAGEQVLKHYRVREDLKKSFKYVSVEVDSNSPFLAGALQLGKFEFLLIAPATSNTVAKISVGIADTLLCNAAIMALKAFVPVYILPSDYDEGIVVTKLPSGRDLKLKVRKEDVSNTRKLVDMDGVYVLEKPQDIPQIFIKHFS